MTPEESIENNYRNTRTLIYRCSLSNNRDERMKYGRILLDQLDESNDSTLKMVKMVDELIDKLMQASKTIQNQNEWIDCLTNAIDGRDNSIMYAALTARKTLETYKKKKSERKD